VAPEKRKRKASNAGKDTLLRERKGRVCWKGKKSTKTRLRKKEKKKLCDIGRRGRNENGPKSSDYYLPDEGGTQ